MRGEQRSREAWSRDDALTATEALRRSEQAVAQIVDKPVTAYSGEGILGRERFSERLEDQKILSA